MEALKLLPDIALFKTIENKRENKEEGKIKIYNSLCDVECIVLDLTSFQSPFES